MTLFQGAGVALVTPFREDKSVNYEELTRLSSRNGVTNATPAP